MAEKISVMDSYREKFKEFKKFCIDHNKKYYTALQEAIDDYMAKK